MGGRALKIFFGKYLDLFSWVYGTDFSRTISMDRDVIL